MESDQPGSGSVKQPKNSFQDGHPANKINKIGVDNYLLFNYDYIAYKWEHRGIAELDLQIKL